MPAPNLTFSASRTILSDEAGFDSITVTFSSDIEYQAFQCRATKVGENWGLGIGTLVASFSQTPAGVERTFEIYDDYLLQGDGEYRISLFAQGMDGSWNDNWAFIPLDSDGLITSDGNDFLVAKQQTIITGPRYLQYIQSSGQQYIDTGISAPNGFRLVAEVELTQATGSMQAIIGSHSEAPPYYRNYLCTSTSFLSWEMGCFDYFTFGAIATNVKYVIDFCNVYGQLNCVINGVNQNIPQGTSTNPQRDALSLYLLALHYSNMLPAFAKLYSAKIYVDGALVRDYSPCLDLSGTVCLYDAVSRSYFYNAGAGEFIPGPQIS